MSIKSYFATQVYYQSLQKDARKMRKLNLQLKSEVYDIAELDTGGLSWSAENYPNGFTSYASANSLQHSSPTFAGLEKMIDGHVRRFAKALDYDLGEGSLRMSTCWVNIMPKNAHHGLHIHPLSVISGTYYVSVPRGASAIKFEDPRLDKFMATPPRKEPCSQKNRNFLSLAPEAGKLVLFESWLRHEVPLNTAGQDRISVSFNYEWV